MPRIAPRFVRCVVLSIVLRIVRCSILYDTDTVQTYHAEAVANDSEGSEVRGVPQAQLLVPSRRSSLFRKTGHGEDVHRPRMRPTPMMTSQEEVRHMHSSGVVSACSSDRRGGSIAYGDVFQCQFFRCVSGSKKMRLIYLQLRVCCWNSQVFFSVDRAVLRCVFGVPGFTVCVHRSLSALQRQTWVGWSVCTWFWRV